MDDGLTERASRIGEVANLAHVSVRTLHHYDAIGLVRPSGRSEAGYRLYTAEDLERLQTVLLYKELGFGLGEIRDLLAEPGFDRREALRAQREQLARRSARIDAMLALIDKTLAAMEEGIPMERGDLFEVFGDFDPTEHEAETEKRWGDTEAYKESARRTRRYTKDDWARFKAESDAVNEAIATLMDEGVRGGRPAGDGRRGAAPPAHRRVVLPVLARDARAARADVRGRPSLHRDLREDPPRDGRVRARRDRRERAQGRLSSARAAAARRRPLARYSSVASAAPGAPP